jgi:oxysterol-binding protein 1
MNSKYLKLIKKKCLQVKFVLNGCWDSKMEYAPVTSTTGPPENQLYKNGKYKTIWERRIPPVDMPYNFTVFACQLNEFEDGIAPTDSRLRPDQRLMENAQYDESNVQKLR